MSEQTANPYIFGDPIVDRQRLDAIANVYSAHIQRHAYEYVGKEAKSIIDIGCGEGQLGFALLAMYPDATLVGVDRDAKALATAEQYASEHGLNARFVQADIQETIPDGNYDIAMCFTVLEHVPRYSQALDNIIAHLNPGGHIWAQDIASTGCFAGYPNANFQRAVELYLEAMKKLGNNMLIMDELSDLLSAKGMQDVQSHKIDYPVGGVTSDGQNMLANIAGGLYAARGFLSKMTGVNEGEIGDIIEGITTDALLNPQPGYLRAMNVVARKPIEGSP